MVDQKIGCLIIAEDGKPIGIFSERDVLLRVSHILDEVADKPISEFMTKRPERLDENTPLAFALNMMSVGDFRHLPVLRDGELAGVISLRDVLSYFCSWYPELIRA